jgi:group I intron endonuclease
MGKKPIPQIGIYCIRNTVNGRIYVGSSIDIRMRWYSHKSNLRLGRHHARMLQRSWGKHGAEAFVFEILELLEKNDDLDAAEQRWIDNFSAAKVLFNSIMTAGFDRSQESLAKRSEPRRPCPEETRAKIGDGNRNKIRSAEHRAAVSRAQSGRKHSLEEIEKRRQIGIAFAKTPKGIALIEYRKKRLAEARALRRALGIKINITEENRQRAIAQLVAANKSPERRASASVRIKKYNASPEAIVNRRKPRVNNKITL